MGSWQTFDLASLLVGLVIGVVLAGLLRPRIGNSISLDVKRIGCYLGVGGFEDAVTPGLSGDERATGRVRTTPPAIKIARKESLQAKTEDVAFRKRLNEIVARRGDDWFAKYLKACLAQGEIHSIIDEKVRNFGECGWSIRTMSFDNIAGGLHVIFDLERPYEVEN